MADLSLVLRWKPKKQVFSLSHRNPDDYYKTQVAHTKLNSSISSLEYPQHMFSSCNYENDQNVKVLAAKLMLGKR